MTSWQTDCLATWLTKWLTNSENAANTPLATAWCRFCGHQFQKVPRSPAKIGWSLAADPLHPSFPWANFSILLEHKTMEKHSSWDKFHLPKLTHVSHLVLACLDEFQPTQWLHDPRNLPATSGVMTWHGSRRLEVKKRLYPEGLGKGWPSRIADRCG